MTLRLSKRVQRVSLSANAAAKSQATALREAGRDILDLTTGEPDFDTPSTSSRPLMPPSPPVPPSTRRHRA